METGNEVTSWPPQGCAEIRVWLNARADGECTPSQEGVLAQHLCECRGCALEWAALERTRTALENARLREPTDFELEALAQALVPRILNLVGWTLLLVGGLVLAAFGTWQLLFVANLPLMARLGLAALGLGTLLLLTRVAWDRLRVFRHDPYRAVKR